MNEWLEQKAHYEKMIEFWAGRGQQRREKGERLHELATLARQLGHASDADHFHELAAQQFKEADDYARGEGIMRQALAELEQQHN